MIFRLINIFNQRILFPRRERVVIRELAPKLSAGALVLDFGCGIGHLSAGLGRASGTRIIGVDIYRPDRAFNPMVVYDGVRLPFKDRTFDGAVMIDMLHHTDNIEGAIRAVSRVTRGFLLIKDMKYRGRIGYNVLKFTDYWTNKHDPGARLRYNYLGIEEWYRTFTKSGLRVRFFQPRFKLIPFDPIQHLNFIALLDTDGDTRKTEAKDVAFSVIIPTLNEEGYIGSLLESLAHQTIKNFEVIIVDGGSNDRTRGVVKAFEGTFQRLHLATETKRGLGRARNVGAALASSDTLIFMEADCVVESDFFEVIMAEILDKEVGCANVLSIPLSRHWFDRLYYKLLLDYFLRIAQFLSPVISGYFIFVRRSVFERLKGFNEHITFEDTDLAKRARKLTRFRILKRRRVYTSTRRLNSDGRLRCLVRSILVTLYQFILGNIPISDRLYRFGHHRRNGEAYRDIIAHIVKPPPAKQITIKDK